MSTLVLANCRLIATMDDARTELRDASILIEDGWIRRVGILPESKPADETLDCRRYVALPGLINAHHHLYQTLTRGFPENQGQPLFPWLQMLYPIWAGLDEEMIYASTRAGLAELLLSGCTTSSDHLYVFPAGSEHFIDAQVEAARTLGVRFHPTRGSMDLGESKGGLPPDTITQDIDTILADSERVIQAYHDPNPGAMVRIGLAPCSPFSATTELTRQTAELGRRNGVRLHTHIAETLDEEAFSREKFGAGPIELLESLGWMQDDVWLAHGVHVSDTDIDVMAEGGVAVAHCPTSNMLLGSGIAPVASYLAAGVTVGLGVDGSASNDGNDLRQEVKQAVLAARVRSGPASMPARDALAIATRGSAAALGRSDIGSIEAGKAADIILFDLDELPVAGGHEDLVAMIVLGATRPATVLVHGRVIVRDGRLITADAREIARSQNAASARLMRRSRGEDVR